MSATGSWVCRLHATAPPDELEPTCLPETWNRTVAGIGIGASSWAVEFCRELATLSVDPKIPAARRAEATEELRPTAEAVVMEALVALCLGRAVPTTVPPETTRQIARAVRQRISLERILAFQRASHARFSDALVSEFRRLVPADQQSEGLSDLSRFLVDLVSSFSLACSAAYAAEEQAWLTSIDGSRGELVRTLLRGDHTVLDPAKALRYELANRTHVSLILRRDAHDDDAESEGLDRVAAKLLTCIGATAHLVIPSDEREVWAWGGFTDPRSAAVRSIPVVPGALVAVGRPARGLDGFRATHEEAKAAARVTLYSAARSRGRTVFFDDVRLVALLTSDPERAQSFVRDELGALGHPRESLLRETVRVYLECNCSPATAAARLDVVKNTVVYRIRRAEAMLGRSVKEQQGILWAALHLVDVVDPVESQYSA
ncbi:PucR family transcriptional regulator [Streptomyces acidiscabies]|uniref:PucR family transcriptional regulator n=1 Tax=Streptomyces acidiscabies TaxID=42234 RepID=UPI000AB3C406|nr:helix-turn-helix domain-containing protein [Streptomyces acidiscabies]